MWATCHKVRCQRMIWLPDCADGMCSIHRKVKLLIYPSLHRVAGPLPIGDKLKELRVKNSGYGGYAC